MNIESLAVFVKSPALVKGLLVDLLKTEARAKVIARETPKQTLRRGLPTVGDEAMEPTLLRRREYSRNGSYRVEQCVLAVERPVHDVAAFEAYMASVEATRAERIESTAKSLYEAYAAQSLTPNWPIHRPGVSEDLRATVRLLHGKGWLKHTPLRVLVWMELREAILHTHENGGKPVELDAPDFIPTTKREERWNRILEAQFQHPNGDRRTDRAHDLTDDPDAESEYNGTPQLAALVPTQPTICRECAAVVRDGVVAIGVAEGGAEYILPPDSEERPIGYRYAIRCDCEDGTRFLYDTDEKLWHSPRALKLHATREQRAEKAAAEAGRAHFAALPTHLRKESLPKEVRAEYREAQQEQEPTDEQREAERLRRRAQARDEDRKLEQQIQSRLARRSA